MIIATAASADLEYVRGLGADRVVDYKIIVPDKGGGAARASLTSPFDSGSNAENLILSLR